MGMSGRGWMEMGQRLPALVVLVVVGVALVSVVVLLLWLPDPPSSPRMGCATEPDLTLRAALHCDEGRP